jgi:hypothetical protein
MAVPSDIQFSAATLVAAHTAFRDLIDAAVTPGSIKIRDADDVLLAEFLLAVPCGTVNGTTGQLTFSLPLPVEALVTGTAAYGEICDGDGVAHLSMPVVAGVSAVPNRFVLSTLILIAAGETSILGATLG